MGNRGRKPKTAVTSGTKISKSVQPPAWMGPHGKLLWKRILPKLGGVANDIDYDAMVAYCSAYNTMIEADILLQREGLMLSNERGTVAHPATRIKAQALDQVRRYQTEFGLTPLARLRVQPVDDEELDALDEML